MPPATTTKPSGQASQSPAAINRAQRNLVLGHSIEMVQQIYQQAVNLANQTQVNIQPRNVGLVKKFIVKITGTANNSSGAAAATLTDFGLSNLLSQVSFVDLNNNTRIQTSGWHLSFLESARQRMSAGAAFVASSLAEFGNVGNNFKCVNAPASIAASGSANFSMYFEVPLAYSDEDLRGALYMNVVNATANLQLNFNTAPFAATGSDSTNAVYSGTGTLSGVQVTVYQVYLDQLPVGKNGVVLPMLDLSTIYELKNTPFSGIVAGTDFPIPYANLRDFLSTVVVFNHDSSADSGRTAGTDLNYLALQSANFTNILKLDPITAAYRTRKVLQSDLPPGCYYLSFRKKPVSTVSYGNMQAILNASSAAAGAYALVGWEDFAMVNTLVNAGSLA